MPEVAGGQLALFLSAIFLRSIFDGKKSKAKDEQEAGGQIISQKISAKKIAG
jgi:hypothetical protein